jgi:iron complex outermembrane receptor protein
MYGGMEPGGLVNLIPRLPSFNDQSSVSGEFGSYNFYRAEADSTGAINPTLAYRMEASFQDNDSFRNFLHQQSIFVGPSITWNPTPDTRWTTWLWYQDLERPQDQGVVFTYKGQPYGPISRNLAGPNNNNTQFIDDLVISSKVEHDITPDLTVSARFLTHYFDGHEDAIRWSTVSAANTISPYYDGSLFNDWQYDLVSDLNWRFDLGPTKHEILFGTELNQNNYHYQRLTDTALPAINIFNPVYPVGPFPLTPGYATQHTLSNDVGVYLQDQMDAVDNRLHFLIGGRVDHVNQDYVAFSNGKHYTQVDTGLSGRAGLLYDVTSWMSPYANIARSFNPNTAGSNLTFAGTTLPPTTGIQYEAGIKFNIIDKKLTLTSDVYQITKNNVAVNDPNHPGFSMNGGELRSRGLEFDLTGQVTPSLQVVGSYAYTNTRVMASTTLPVGAAFINIPPNSGSLWLNYTFQEGALKDFGLGLGMFASEKKAGDNANSFYLPGYVRLDAGSWYTFDLTNKLKAKLQLNVYNMTNKTYYESSSSAGSVEPGTPISVVGKFSIIF